MDTITTGLTTSSNLVSHEACVLSACVGIEIQALGFAPFGEIVRVYINANDADASAFQLLLASKSGLQPLRVGAVEFVAILEHGSEFDEVLGLEPSHTGDLRLHANSSEISNV